MREKERQGKKQRERRRRRVEGKGGVREGGVREGGVREGGRREEGGRKEGGRKKRRRGGRREGVREREERKGMYIRIQNGCTQFNVKRMHTSSIVHSTMNGYEAAKVDLACDTCNAHHMQTVLTLSTHM